MVIPRVGTRLQSFINKAGEQNSFEGGLKPSPTGSDTFGSLLARAPQITDTEDLQSAARAIHRIENPTIHNPETIDCASCHTAAPARHWAVTHFPTLGLDQNEFTFTSLLNLTNLSPHQDSTINLRAFGYFGKQMTTSQRTIHESAAIADRLNQL
jgi:hypothetical protein